MHISTLTLPFWISPKYCCIDSFASFALCIHSLLLFFFKIGKTTARILIAILFLTLSISNQMPAWNRLINNHRLTLLKRQRFPEWFIASPSGTERYHIKETCTCIQTQPDTPRLPTILRDNKIECVICFGFNAAFLKRVL